MLSNRQWHAAEHDAAIVFCVDQKFLKYAAAVINSIRLLVPDLQADICVASEQSVQIPSSLEHLNIRFLTLKPDVDRDTFPVSEDLPFATYLRLFAVDVLAPHYEKILYLDCDIMIESAEFTKIFDIELLPGTAVGAATDLMQLKGRRVRTAEMNSLNIPAFPYFNAGILLIDTRQWIKENAIKGILDIIRSCPQALAFFDQSAMNLYFKGRWTEISYRLNWAVYNKVRLYLNFDKPLILHFVGCEKPWAKECPFVPDHIQSYFDDFLSEHFGVSAPDRPKRRRDFKYIYNLTVINFLKLHRILRRRRRFYDLSVALDPKK